ncbi:MAG TPA: hypothetical protein VEY50_01585 [Lysobacter sp.]|nr:hypothetical protein [Lysobacter sp.]
MKFKTLVLASLTAFATLLGNAHAQEFRFGWNPRTGDMWVDTQLSDINRYGLRYRDPFVDELVRYHGAPRELVIELLVKRRWAPGDVYFACALANIIGRPCRFVVEEYERHHGLGWGELAKRLGIKPGSAEFHRLKRGFVPTYDRWGRPIVLDADLERAYPGRGKGGGKAKGNGHGPDHGGPGRGHGGHGKGGDHKGGGKGKGKGKD